jgi:hypothetical protein
MISSQDILCFVSATSRSLAIVEKVKAHFLGKAEELRGDYACKKDDPKYVFPSEYEMLEYFCSHSSLAQSFYWHPETGEISHKAMVGAHFTADGMLVVSVTVEARTDQAKAKESPLRLGSSTLAELQAVVGSEVGLVSYSVFPEFEDGRDFIARCKSLNVQ